MSFFNRTINYWKFAPIKNIEESDFNKNLENFYSLGINGLIKENIQNSLDGKLPNSDSPVQVKINLATIDAEVIPGITEVIEHINHLKGRNKYATETIQHMLKKIQQQKVNYLSFEDINTKGLSGARNGNSNSKDDTWSIYAYNKGVHYEDDDDKFETIRGGSHGIGKIASNAASDLHLMYFANCDEYGNQHLGGTVQLIEHEYKGKCYRNTGYFTDIKTKEGVEKYYPYENNFDSVFDKKTRGLKIIIPYLRKEYNNEKEIIKSVCDNFFIAILTNRLVVDVNGKAINATTISDYVYNTEYYENQEISEIKNEFVPLYMSTYLKEEPRKIVINNIDRDYKFDLYFKYDENIVKGRVAIVRTIGMKIEDFAVRGKATKPFNAVLIGGPEEDAYLKTLENASHTKITKEHIRDDTLKKQATRFINNLSKEISKIIDEEINKHNKPDGKVDTRDLLYIVENQFKQDLKKSFGTVKTKKKRKVVKGAINIPATRKPGTKKGTRKPTGTGTIRSKKKPSTGSNGEVDESKEVYKVNTNIVNRVITKNEEFIQFDFKGNKRIKEEKSANVLFKIIDGMGKEYDNEFNLQDNYYSIIDQNSKKALDFSKDIIKDISINDGKILLLLELKPDYNRGLKFVYYVEV